MAKGRRLTTGRSDLLLGSYNYSQGQDTVSDASEFGEEDVWSMVGDIVNGEDESVSSSNVQWNPGATPESNGSLNYWNLRPVPRDDRRRRHHHDVGGLSLAFDDAGKTTSPRMVHQFRNQETVAAAASPRGRHMATSAPVNVPDWSKIYRVDSVESLHDSDDGIDDGESEMVPPHEYLGRKMAANSVFEGVGRTLKGRDLSRVRDAVWSQTGFYG